MEAEKRWKRLYGYKRLADIIRLVKFIDGIAESENNSNHQQQPQFKSRLMMFHTQNLTISPGIFFNNLVICTISSKWPRNQSWPIS